MARTEKISWGSYTELLVCFVFMECVNFRLTEVKIPFIHGCLSLSLSLYHVFSVLVFLIVVVYSYCMYQID